ncbi:MAG: hypothetical protein CMM25_08305 [Rhodospirillaceae bacterium]|nr:hypothetical protein [Rhodospirillaceae bacterium]|tara:strand:+ start:2546 stop:3694 length:1149 start_codon:yes stop_codon:yes gene_type:complete
MNIHRTSASTLSHRPSFGCSASFTSTANDAGFGDNFSQRMLKGINSLQMNLSLNFNELTDDESRDLISFLESQFDYEPQAYSSDGSFSNKRITPFNYQPFYPYKNNKFSCLSFNHSKENYNSSNVSATLTCVAPSILSNVESSAGHNSNIDCDITTTSLSASKSDQSIQLTASDNDCVLLSGNTLYSDSDYRKAKLKESKSIFETLSSAVNVNASFGFPSGPISSQHSSLRHSIYIDNPNECSYYPHLPKYKDGNLSVRMFDFRPSNTSSIDSAPKYKAATHVEHYQKLNKYGFNPNLSKLSLTFDARSDLEAKRILFFLESHLGYKKFGFHFSKDYQGNINPNSPPSKSKVGFFYCPEWNHQFIYMDNHTITATFIECVNS